MRVRILQRQDEKGWYDDAYALEDDAGRVTLRYNLTWERVGVIYTRKIQESGITLDHIDQVIQSTERLRWLSVQEVEEPVEAFLAELNKRCGIPEPRPMTKPVVV